MANSTANRGKQSLSWRYHGAVHLNRWPFSKVNDTKSKQNNEEKCKCTICRMRIDERCYRHHNRRTRSTGTNRIDRGALWMRKKNERETDLLRISFTWRLALPIGSMLCSFLAPRNSRAFIISSNILSPLWPFGSVDGLLIAPQCKCMKWKCCVPKRTYASFGSRLLCRIDMQQVFYFWIAVHYVIHTKVAFCVN